MNREQWIATKQWKAGWDGKEKWLAEGSEGVQEEQTVHICCSYTSTSRQENTRSSAETEVSRSQLGEWPPPPLPQPKVFGMTTCLWHSDTTHLLVLCLCIRVYKCSMSPYMTFLRSKVMPCIIPGCSINGWRWQKTLEFQPSWKQLEWRELY